MTKKSLRLSIVVLGFLTGCAHVETKVPEDRTSSSQSLERRHPATSRLAVLPDQGDWQGFYDFVDQLDLNSPDLTYAMRGGGGTSVYTVISRDGKAIGAWIPENNSSSVSGETLSFTLARALGVVDLYQPAVFRSLTGANLAAFETILTTPLSIAAREENRLLILKNLKKHPDHLDAVYKRWDFKPHDYEGASNGTRSINPEHVMKGSTQTLASMITCEGPKPSASTIVTLNGGTNTELEAAREISSILLIDALEQQYDRFTGGNLQTINTPGGRSHFVAFDNGGTWGGSKSTDRALKMVTRFDQNVASQILAMDDFFQRHVPYKGLQTEAEFMSAFDVVNSPDEFKKFKSALKDTAKHIREHDGCYF